MVSIAVAQIDGKWPNLALAKLVAWHRLQGDQVERFSPLRQYDRVYASKVFLDTPDDPYVPLGAIKGGSAFSLVTDLPPYVESMLPDFSLWPGWAKSLGFSTRGCIRHCSFCVVPRKEGAFRVVAEFGELWDGKSRELVLLDNNLTAAPIEHFRGLYEDARRFRVTLDVCQGFDARLWTDEHAAIVANGPAARRLHFAFDNVRDEPSVRRAVHICEAAGVPARRLTFYVLVGFNTTEEEDLHRIDVLTGLGVDPFVMPYNRHDQYQRMLARWCNSVTARKSCSWQEYRDNVLANGYRRITTVAQDPLLDRV
jgi:hypothetical protein